MRYLILIYGSEQQWDALPPETVAQVMQDYGTYTEELAASGALRGGEQLAPSYSATTVRVRDGKRHITDGPFAETKEQLGGYYMIETDTLDEATAWAAKCPGASDGCVEVRPIIDNPAP